MVDTIDEDDVTRIDTDYTDPTAFTESEIEDSLGEGFDSSAKDAFAQRIAEKREPVRRKASSMLVSKIDANGQLHAEDGTFVGTGSSVDLEVDESGAVYGENENTGRRAQVGTIDLSEGVSGRRTGERR